MPATTIVDLPVELLLRIIQYISNISNKSQLLQTCRHFNTLLCTHVASWSPLDLSRYPTIRNSELLLFLKNCNITINKTNTNMMTSLNLSGCWCLSHELIGLLSMSFVQLEELYLNGYGNMNKSQLFEQQREHVYQVRPIHDLSSMSMDLSKSKTNRLKITSKLLSNALHNLKHIKLLSIQYQDITGPFNLAKNIQYLDISSSNIIQSELQSMLKRIGLQLKTLKMLNIELNNLSWLCLSQYGKELECLHVSCQDSLHLNCVCHTINHLHQLKDFRLTRIRGGSIDHIIEQLNCRLMSKLDISPKMNIYPKSVKKHPIDNIMTTSVEHDLLLSSSSIAHLSKCSQLRELRLCFPTVDITQQLFMSLSKLEIFEYRRSENYVFDITGLKYLIRLKELYLYGVTVSDDSLLQLSPATLKCLTITNSNDNWIEDKENQVKILTHYLVLKSLCIGHLNQAITCKSIWPNSSIENHILADTHHISFKKHFYDRWLVQ